MKERKTPGTVHQVVGPVAIVILLAALGATVVALVVAALAT